MTCDTDDSNHPTTNDTSDWVVAYLSIDLLLSNLFVPSLLVLSIHGISSSKFFFKQPAWLFLDHELIRLWLYLLLSSVFTKEGFEILIQFLSLSCLDCVDDLTTQVVDWSLWSYNLLLWFSWFSLALWLLICVWSPWLLHSFRWWDDCIFQVKVPYLLKVLSFLNILVLLWL